MVFQGAVTKRAAEVD